MTIVRPFGLDGRWRRMPASGSAAATAAWNRPVRKARGSVMVMGVCLKSCDSRHGAMPATLQVRRLLLPAGAIVSFAANAYVFCRIRDLHAGVFDMVELKGKERQT